VTSFDYSVTIDDPQRGFDVYFVPSKNEFDNWKNGEEFQYYSDDGCSAKGYLSFNGGCNGVAKESGLLVLTQDQLTNSIATLTVTLQEQTSSYQPQNTNTNSPQQPPSPSTTPTNPVTGVVRVDQKQYLISVGQSTQVTISGTVDDPHGGKVILTISKPDGTLEVLRPHITGIGDFSTPIFLDYYSAVGQYQIYAEYENSDFGSTSFNVMTDSPSTESVPYPLSNQQPPSQTDVVPQPTQNTSSSENILQVEGTHFSVPYSITGGNVLGISADTQAKSLIIPMQTTNDGKFTITLPRVLIDAKNGQQDDQFFVLIDGKESSFMETKTKSGRTLSIQFPEGTEQIEIIGTQLVPEFGSITSLVLVIAIISIIVISAKPGIHFARG
jgi:predicted secreted protein with PEFG-CTERM motif